MQHNSQHFRNTLFVGYFVESMEGFFKEFEIEELTGKFFVTLFGHNKALKIL